jgi:carbon-monoxide dehydrogenase medium subunit
MYPGKFDYHKPDSVDEAVALLGRFGEDAKILAGGHSLVPMMKLRLAEPANLIDVNGINDLKGIREANGSICIGAATTQAEVLASTLLKESCALIPEASALIADPQVRYCATVGGNVANGDPGNDLPAIMMALGATYVLRGPTGERSVAARDFYKGVYTTDLGEDELLIEVHVPALAAGQGSAYEKMKRKVGDYAIAASAVVLTMSGATCESAAIALTNVGETPLFAVEAGASLAGKSVDEDAIAKAARLAMGIATPVADLRGTVEFRTAMAGEMTRRAIRRAIHKAAARAQED